MIAALYVPTSFGLVRIGGGYERLYFGKSYTLSSLHRKRSGDGLPFTSYRDVTGFNARPRRSALTQEKA